MSFLKKLDQPALPLSDGAPAPSLLNAPSITAKASRAIHFSGYEREGKDFYATPPGVTEGLLQHVKFRAPV